MALSHAAYIWVVGSGLLGYLMFQQFIERGYSWYADHSHTGLHARGFCCAIECMSSSSQRGLRRAIFFAGAGHWSYSLSLLSSEACMSWRSIRHSSVARYEESICSSHACYSARCVNMQHHCLDGRRWASLRVRLHGDCTQTGHGLSFSALHDGHNGMATAMVIMAAEWPALLTLAWYFGQVLPSGAHPSRRAVLFAVAACGDAGWSSVPNAHEHQALNTFFPIVHDSSYTLAESGVRKHPLFFLDSCLPRRTCSGGQVSDVSDVPGTDAGSVLVSLQT